MKNRINSFRYALEGIRTLFKEEPNARIHVFAGIIAITMGVYFKIETLEWIGVVLSIGLVFCAEAFNSSVENICDGLTNEQNPFVKKAKDLGAAGVLISALTAFIIGLLIFGPKLYALIF